METAYSLLDRISSSLVNLQSSANYMGYDALADFYAEWLEEVAVCKNSLLQGAEIDIQAHRARLARVLETFPQIELKDPAPIPPEPESGTGSSSGPAGAAGGSGSSTSSQSADFSASSNEDDFFATLSSALDSTLGPDGSTPPAGSGGYAQDQGAPAAQNEAVQPQTSHKLGFLDNEVFEEDYDEELFSIFIDQLTVKMRATEGKHGGFSPCP